MLEQFVICSTMLHLSKRRQIWMNETTALAQPGCVVRRLNSVLRRHVDSPLKPAFQRLATLKLVMNRECCRRTLSLNRKEQLRHHAVGLQLARFSCCSSIRQVTAPFRAVVQNVAAPH